MFSHPRKREAAKLENAFQSWIYFSINLVADTTRQLLGDSYKSNSDYIDFSEHSKSLPRKMTNIMVLEKIISEYYL
jgi:hypothetical protein